ncbi:MAG: ribosome-associated translation inhibitor RaiA [Deltaproteobacteria bacterium]|nr:ribosome-associated translation inhibitor RaiA [Deltaproteobacteria bacterium]
MNFEVSFRNLQARDEVRERANVLFGKLHRFLDPAAEGALTLAVEHGQVLAEAVLTSRGATYKVAEEDGDLRTAMDKAFHTLEAQLRRAKERRLEGRRPSDEDEVE